MYRPNTYTAAQVHILLSLVIVVVIVVVQCTPYRRHGQGHSMLAKIHGIHGHNNYLTYPSLLSCSVQKTWTKSLNVGNDTWEPWT